MDITFNKIYVIESLHDNERKTGTALHDDIIRRKLWKHTTIKSDIVTIESKHQFISCFESIKAEVLHDNCIPYLHFEIHGNPNGFNLSSDEQVNWREIYHRLMEINILVRNRIWMSLATCYGAWIYSIVLPMNPAPFYGMIGAWSELHTLDLQASFERYFDVLLDKFDLSEAIVQLNLENPRLPVEYKLHTSEAIFQRVYSNYDADFDNPIKFAKRLDDIVEEGMRTPGNRFTPELLREAARQALIQTRADYKRQHRNAFFMIDRYPENADRFKE